MCSGSLDILKQNESHQLCKVTCCWCVLRESSSPGCLKKVLQPEQELKWETNSWRCKLLSYLTIMFLWKMDTGVFFKWTSQFNFSLHIFSTGERSRPPRSRTPHSSGGSAELWCYSFHDGATGAYGGAGERHHHHSSEAWGWLLPAGEAEQRYCLQHGDESQRAQAAALHLPDPKWQGAGIQHRGGQRVNTVSHWRHGEKHPS